MSNTLALYGLPHLIQPLTDAGYQVVSADSDLDAAKAIQGALTDGHTRVSAALIRDTGAPYLSKFVSAVSSRVPRCLILYNEASFVPQKSEHIHLPVECEVVLHSAQIEPIEHLAGRTLLSDGSLSTVDNEWGLDFEDDDEDDDFPVFDNHKEETHTTVGPQEDSREPQTTFVADNSTHNTGPIPHARIPRTTFVSALPNPHESTGEIEHTQPVYETPTPTPQIPQPKVHVFHPSMEPTFDTPHSSPTPANEQPAPSLMEEIFEPAATSTRRLSSTTIFSISGKGGVGKTTTAITLAERASSRGIKTTLIDANRGQSDVGRFLRLPLERTPTIYDAVAHSSSHALLTPDFINSARPHMLPDITYSVILGPPRHYSSPDIVTSEVYADAIAYAETVSELVVVDTQIMESTDTSGIFDYVTIPMLQHGAWALGVSGLSPVSIDNLRSILTTLHMTYGIERERLLAFVNAAPEKGAAHASMARIPEFAQTFSTFLGHVSRHDELMNAFNSGITGDLPDELISILDDVLSRTLGLPKPPREKKKQSMLGRFFGGK